jgi:hypothetical protein
LCGEKGATITLIKTKELKGIIGGFTDISWNSVPFRDA